MIDDQHAVGPWGWATLGILALAVALAVWLRPDAGTAETLAARVARGAAIRIGYANEAPYGYLDSATGRVTGEAPEVAQFVLRRMGVEEIETVVTEFGSLIPGLKARRFDIIAAGMYITPERCREIAFSNPTYRMGESFIVQQGNPLGLHSFADVARHATARLGVVGGAVEHGYAKAEEIPSDRIIVFPDNASGLAGVSSGRVDAFAATLLTVNDLLRKANTSAVERAEPFRDPVIDGKPASGYGAFGFRRSDEEFVEQFNAQLAKFLGSEEHLRLVEPFGFDEATLPGAMTARELCNP